MSSNSGKRKAEAEAAGGPETKRQQSEIEKEEQEYADQFEKEEMAEGSFKDKFMSMFGFLKSNSGPLDALYKKSANNRRDIVKDDLESLPVEERGQYLERFATDIFRMATLADEVYEGTCSPWDSKRYSGLVKKCEGTKYAGKFRLPVVKDGKPQVLPVYSPNSSLVDYVAEKVHIERREPSMWAANVGPAGDGGNYGEVVFRGTDKTKADFVADGYLAVHQKETDEWNKHYWEALVGFIKEQNITRLSVSGHSLGGFRACTIGLCSEVVMALHGEVMKATREVPGVIDVLKERIRVVALDPAGTSRFPGDKGEKEDWTAARASVITTVSQSVTIVSGYATEHIAPIHVFDKLGYKGMRKRLGFRAVREGESPTSGKLKLSAIPHSLSQIMEPMEFLLRGLTDFGPEFSGDKKGHNPSRAELEQRLAKQGKIEAKLEETLLGIITGVFAEYPARGGKKESIIDEE